MKFTAKIKDDKTFPIAPGRMPDTPDMLEISEEGEGLFFLYYYDRNGEMLGDECYFSLEEAKEQGFYLFGIEDTDWGQSADKFHKR